MEKFLKNHKLTEKYNYGGDCFLIEVSDKSNKLIDDLYCFSIYDVLRVTGYYLVPDENFRYKIKVTKI